MNPQNQIPMKRVLFLSISILIATSLVAQKNLPEVFHFSKNQVKPGMLKANTQEGMIKMDSMIQQIDFGEGFMDFFKGHYIFNDNGQLIQIIEHEADFETGEMAPSYNYNYYYDGANRIAELNYEWDTTLNDWQYDDSTYYTYTSGLITQEDFFWYDTANTEWDHDFITYYYYTASVLDSVIETQWNGSGYENNEITKYSYTNGEVSEEVIQYWDGGQWINDDKFIYTWDGEKLTEYIEMTWDEGLSQWVNAFRYTYAWETNGNLIEEIDYEWNTDLEQWDEMSKLDPVYDNTVAREEMVLPFYEGEEGNPLLFFDHKVDTATLYNQEQVKAWQEMAKMIFHYSEFVGIDETAQSENIDFQVYPNPASTYLTIKTDTNNSVNIAIYDATGRLVKNSVISNNANINIEDLAQGIYFIQFKKGTNTLKAKKFIVQ
ncbi:hypothetical protein L21SP5_03229 [Salinivirga cyanobacteriivorans]|uniref:Secretion system C-terminal sorting domain-containing protein n=2 Tax=Salinivirga cyanobacteriivorans TaxID=1307839 RepID=A0A0S2I3T0_9BACT|nr:hypothetical protein L21SP5_03229 [Salinivirga cyanobacteriivorans]